jgi:hypothetical protein
LNTSLQNLKALLVSKSGYNIVPNHDCLNSLKTTINDMITYRNSYSCSGHVNQQFAGKLSMGDLTDFANNIKPCTCNANTSYGCSCDSRSSCLCESRSGTSDNLNYLVVCTCKTYIACECQSRIPLVDPVCYCNSRTTSCDCVSRQGLTYGTCLCNGRTEGCSSEVTYLCDCYSRTGTSSCDCNSRTGSCSCQSECNCNGNRNFG